MKTSLRHKDAGKFIPKTVFTDVDAEKHILSIKYEDWGEALKTIRKVRKKLKEVESKKVAQPAPKKAEPPRDYVWKNTKNKTIKAQFTDLSDGFVTLKLSSGKKVKYPLDKLSDDSQKLAEKLSKNAEKGSGEQASTNSEL